eukprot:TRINITY_DN23471_c0_g1_i1.p1 TRINITY_DN23471_c0_g1~~TRINITY_DN23471_c0_g1_i1.p1  ORF type:complete len:441 (+),score=78.14 TRINITY_DN23471_c0_g1_i1:102-1424(+)
MEKAMDGATSFASEGVRSFDSVVVSGMQGMFVKDPSYHLFEYKDAEAWAIFSAVFVALITFDHFVLNKANESLTLEKAVKYTLFWMMTACCFCIWVYFYFGSEEAAMWMSGYMLEWMLSFDNLFVFHLIFSVYGTPEHLKHRPLYIGICGAVIFRLIFLLIGEYLMHAAVFMHLVFGSFLVYTGVQTLVAEEEDEDPSQNAFVQWIQQNLPFIDVYDKSGAFFVEVPIDEQGEPLVKPAGESILKNSGTGKDDNVQNDAKFERDKSPGSGYGAVDFAALESQQHKLPLKEPKWETRATMLFLVVCCLEVSDMIFAVDSVSAIVAQVNDLFLAYTSAVFAMLGLRATFFIIDVLVHMFSLLKYGVAAVLVFVGVKLMLSHIYHIPAGIVCIVIVSSICTSMVASVFQESMEKKADDEEFEDVKERIERVKAEHTPLVTSTA